MLEEESDKEVKEEPSDEDELPELLVKSKGSLLFIILQYVIKI